MQHKTITMPALAIVGEVSEVLPDNYIHYPLADVVTWVDPYGRVMMIPSSWVDFRSRDNGELLGWG